MNVTRPHANKINVSQQQQQKQPMSLRRRLLFHRQDSPHSVTALHIGDENTYQTSAMQCTSKGLNQEQNEVEIPAQTTTSCLKKSSLTINKSKRSVHFYETVTIGSIPKLDQYSETELASMYYSPEEEQVLRSEAKSVVRALRAGSRLPQHNLDKDNYCTRGLENYLLPREERRSRSILTKEHIYSVIDAQKFMTMESKQGVNDHALAMVSLRSSNGFRDAAMERAARDEAEVKMLLLQHFKDQIMATQAEKQQERVVAVRRASMPNCTSNHGSARAACA